MGHFLETFCVLQSRIQQTQLFLYICIYIICTYISFLTWESKIEPFKKFRVKEFTVSKDKARSGILLVPTNSVSFSLRHKKPTQQQLLSWESFFFFFFLTLVMMLSCIENVILSKMRVLGLNTRIRLILIILYVSHLKCPYIGCSFYTFWSCGFF